MPITDKITTECATYTCDGITERDATGDLFPERLAIGETSFQCPESGDGGAGQLSALELATLIHNAYLATTVADGTTTDFPEQICTRLADDDSGDPTYLLMQFSIEIRDNGKLI
jgi:hypothetical protein